MNPPTANDPAANPPPGAVRVDGAAHAWFAYDIGQQIDLDLAQRRIAVGTEREQIRHQRRAPSYLQFDPAPLRVAEAAPALALGAFVTDGQVEATLYDFGAVSIAYRIELAGCGLDELRALATALAENSALLADSQQRVRALIARLADAVDQPQCADLVEDYHVFHLRRWTPEGDPRGLVDGDRARIARILRAEPDAMRDSEVDDALQFRLGYGPQDDLVVDWSGAILFDPAGEDTLAVLEFANVELLEMRYLDDRLDDAVDHSHDVLRSDGARGAYWRLHRGKTRATMRSIAALQIESVLLFESVNNALKLLGDQFLARVYRLAARRFHLEEWDQSILRKLQTLEGIYSKFSDEQSTRRMELLEWIIILLFVFSIVIPFVAGAGH